MPAEPSPVGTTTDLTQRRALFEQQSVPFLKAAGCPTRLIERVFSKASLEQFDAGASFGIAAVEPSDDDDDDEMKQGLTGPSRTAERVLVTTRDIELEVESDPVWLVDHAWSFRQREGRSQLAANPALLDRVATMLELHPDHPDHQSVDAVFAALPAKVGSYRLANESTGEMDGESCWYLTDEVGTALAHSSEPNMRMALVPAFFTGSPIMLSVMWPLCDLEEGDICTIDRSASILSLGGSASSSEAQAAAELRAVWIYGDEEEKEESLKRCKAALAKRRGATTGPEATARFEKAMRKARGGGGDASRPWARAPDDERSSPLKLYTDSDLLAKNVTDTDRFVVVDDASTADIVWLWHEPSDPASFPNARLIFQYPEEEVFTNKGRLAAAVRDAGALDRGWLCESYCADTELHAAVAAFLERTGGDDATSPQHAPSLVQKQQPGRYWIVKPHNLARSMDMAISDQLPWLLRLTEGVPKLLCKYIEQPATIRGRKFDLRFIVGLAQLPGEADAGLELFLYKPFWVRTSPEPFSMTDTDRYEKHWTVMNYADKSKILQLRWEEFVQEFNAEQSGEEGGADDVWGTAIYPQVKRMLVELFGGCVPRGTEEATAAAHQAGRLRGMYGVDVMLRRTAEGTIEPALLEVTFSPDCTRACDFYPQFFNNVLSALVFGAGQDMERLAVSQ